jgi:hypothetical protein
MKMKFIFNYTRRRQLLEMQILANRALIPWGIWPLLRDGAEGKYLFTSMQFPYNRNSWLLRLLPLQRAAPDGG